MLEKTTVDNSTNKESVSDFNEKLQGNMGVPALVMSVLAFSAPLITVAGTMPVLLMFGGNSAPTIYLIITILLLLFAVGFAKMGTIMQNPGGFYAFITQGIGKPAGLGAAFLATVGYSCIGLFAPPYLGLFISNIIENDFNGPSIPWFIIALIFIGLSIAFAYNRIDLSAKVLIIVMVCECIVVVIFDVASFIHGGPSDGGGSVLSMPSVASATFGVAMLFAIGNFLGFEATVIYREEVKEPKKTIPRATYIAVISIGTFYFIAAWAYVVFYGADNVQAAATDDVAGIFLSAMSVLVNDIMYDISAILTIGSTFAAMLAIHNVAARYLYSLGVDKVLPKVFGKVHPKQKSPYVAATTIGVVWLIVISIFAISGKDPEYLYPLFSGSGTFAVLLILVVASLSVLVYMSKRRESKSLSMWTSVIAPAIATCGLIFCLFYAIRNYSELIGATGPVLVVFFVATLMIGVIGFVYALYLKNNKPEVYQKIGRQQL